MTERLRQIKKRESEKILYDLVFVDIKAHNNDTLMYVQDIRHINSLKKRGIIREH